MRSRIRITVSNPQNLNDAEDQVYTNYNGLSTVEIIEALGNDCVLAPEVGNFPHMGGHNKPVKITGIVATLAEDNAGLDIANVIERYKDWGSRDG